MHHSFKYKGQKIECGFDYSHHPGDTLTPPQTEVSITRLVIDGKNQPDEVIAEYNEDNDFTGILADAAEERRYESVRLYSRRGSFRDAL